jgi:hypothetical protein
VPPIIAALDSDKDGLISAEEIAVASASLKKLDKNGDGKITVDELRPEGSRGQGGRFAPGREPSGRPDAREQGGQRPGRADAREQGGQRPGRPDAREQGGQRPAPGENPTRRRRPQLEEDQ